MLAYHSFDVTIRSWLSSNHSLDPPSLLYHQPPPPLSPPYHYPLIHSSTPLSPTHPLIHPIIHSPTHPPYHPLTHSFTLSPPTHSSTSLSPTHQLIHPITHPPTHPPFCHPPTHSSTLSPPTHSSTLSPPTHSSTLSPPTHSSTLSPPTHSSTQHLPILLYGVAIEIKVTKELANFEKINEKIELWGCYKLESKKKILKNAWLKNMKSRIKTTIEREFWRKTKLIINHKKLIFFRKKKPIKIKNKIKTMI